MNVQPAFKTVRLVPKMKIRVSGNSKVLTFGCIAKVSSAVIELFGSGSVFQDNSVHFDSSQSKIISPVGRTV